MAVVGAAQRNQGPSLGLLAGYEFHPTLGVMLVRMQQLWVSLGAFLSKHGWASVILTLVSPFGAFLLLVVKEERKKLRKGIQLATVTLGILAAICTAAVAAERTKADQISHQRDVENEAQKQQAHEREVAAERKAHEEDVQALKTIQASQRAQEEANTRSESLQAKLDEKTDAIQKGQQATLDEVLETDTVPCIGRYVLHGHGHAGTPLYIRAIGSHPLHNLYLRATDNLGAEVFHYKVDHPLYPDPMGQPIPVDRVLPRFMSVKISGESGTWIENMGELNAPHITADITIDFARPLTGVQKGLISQCISDVQ